LLAIGFLLRKGFANKWQGYYRQGEGIKSGFSALDYTIFNLPASLIGNHMPFNGGTTEYKGVV
jgi:hypothetical protein